MDSRHPYAGMLQHAMLMPFGVKKLGFGNATSLYDAFMFDDRI